MKVEVLEECGFDEAMLGLSLSYRQPAEEMLKVAKRLAFKGDGHNKFMESIMVWLDVIAPRYWWQQFDTYRVGVTKQSESTMHTMTSRLLTQDDFAHPISEEHLAFLNRLIKEKNWEEVKWNLPESFLQRRIVCLNYMALQRIIRQRWNHRLPEWSDFVLAILPELEHHDLLWENPPGSGS